MLSPSIVSFVAFAVIQGGSRVVLRADNTIAPAVIAVVGVVGTDRIVSVVDLTTPAALPVAGFTAGAAKITQAATNLSTKKLLIQTLPIVG